MHEQPGGTGREHQPRLLAAILGDVHDVITATGGAAALARLERGDFDAVVCDLMMPDVSGMDVLEWIELHRPELTSRVVLLTGGAVTPKSQELVRRTAAPVLMKPMAPEALLAAIERVRPRR